MDTSKITFDQLPYVVSGLSEKLDRVLDLLEKAGIAGHSKQSNSSRRLVYAKEACQIIGKSLSTLYRAVKTPKEPKRLRYLVSDVTQEGLSAIHSHNPRGLCL